MVAQAVAVALGNPTAAAAVDTKPAPKPSRGKRSGGTKSPQASSARRGKREPKPKAEVWTSRESWKGVPITPRQIASARKAGISDTLILKCDKFTIGAKLAKAYGIAHEIVA